MVLIISLRSASAQDYIQWDLPASAKLRLGKGTIKGLQFSPDGTRLAVTTSIGIWLYDIQAAKEIDVFAAHTGNIRSVSFSPDGKILASGSGDSSVRLSRSRYKTQSGTVWDVVAAHPVDASF